MMHSNFIAIDLAKNIFQVVKFLGFQRLIALKGDQTTAVELPSCLGTRHYLPVDKNLLT